MNARMLCRPTKPSKNTKLCASQSARSSLAPAGLREFEGRALNRGSSPNATNKTSWANKENDGKRTFPCPRDISSTALTALKCADTYR